MARDYYRSLGQLSLLHATHEGAVRSAFGTVLDSCARKFRWTLVNEYEVRRRKKLLRVDGAIVDPWSLTHGFWEAKDEDDDLAVEAKKKLDLGYPDDNIIFQSPERAILYQGGKRVADEKIDAAHEAALVDVVREFFRYEPPQYEEWGRAVADFKDQVPQLARALEALIAKERTYPHFRDAFMKFAQVCRVSLNPALTDDAVEKMLVQHILTERLFRRVFDNPDFVRRNAIAVEIEQVIDKLTARSWNREKFLGGLDRFYAAIEGTAGSIQDFTEKQAFLNKVYESFFQGFDEKVADTHGIVYTPQPIVRFMVKSVDEILQREFGKSLGDKGVHILDPFVGTGNFILNVMRHIPKTRLGHKYAHELHANEVMLLPYYIASMNLEHEFAELTGQYEPFEGLCLVDTFELAEDAQKSFAGMTEKNTARVEAQKKAPITVIIGNPPYNAWQVSENDGNKNRKYKVIDRRVAETYARDSRATLVNSLSDPYVKAFRWASDRLGDEGVLAYVSNNGFLDGFATDGMRRTLARDFSTIYHFDLKGNARTTAERRRREGGNIFNDQVRVGVGITLLIRKKDHAVGKTEVFIYRTADYGRVEAKLKELDSFGSYEKVPWQAVEPDDQATWLTSGLRDDFKCFMPLVGQEAGGLEANGIFETMSNGLQSNNDAYVFGFERARVEERAAEMVRAYNDELARWIAAGEPPEIESFLRIDPSQLTWVRKTKRYLGRAISARFDPGAVVESLYRPYVKQSLFFDRMFNEEVYSLPQVFAPQMVATRAIAVTGIGMRSPFASLVTSVVPERHLCASTDAYQVLSLQTLASGIVRDNVTDRALVQFCSHYGDPKITKWQIFHYVYGLLHHPDYRTRYEANLKRELPRIPFAPDFHGFATAGEKLATLHLDYEKQPEYPLKRVEMPGAPLDWRVVKMKLSKDKTQLVYNDFLTLAGIPPETSEYRLGNRSALEWIVDQYQVSRDKRSGIVNDPNRADDPEYIVRLVGQVVTVSLETMKLVRALSPLDAMTSTKAEGVGA